MSARLLAACTLAFACCIGWAQAPAPPAAAAGELVHEGVVPASLGKTWTAWTTSAGLRSWLAPHAEIDFRIGGKMRANYDAAASLDDPRTIENMILSYDPHRMLSIQVAKAPNDFPFPKAVYDMWTVVYFEEVAPEQTHVRIVAHGFTDDEESQRMRAFFARGNAATLKQMQDRIR